MNIEDAIIFHQDDLRHSSFIAFEEMRRSGDLCDVTLNVANSSLSAHRVVLAATIPYFRTTFSNSRAIPKFQELCLDDLDYKALELLIDFAYSCKIRITIENAQSLIRASRFLKLDQVTEACVEFLSKRMSVENVIQIHAFAHNMNNSKLQEISYGFILENFEAISRCDNFLSLPYSCVKEVISDDDLSVSEEEKVFEAVIKWVKASPSQRLNDMADLLAEVRMVHVSYYYLIKRVASEELIKTSEPCNDLVDKVKNYHLLPNDRALFSDLKVTPRKYRSKTENDLLYAVCQCSPSGISVYRFDSYETVWCDLARQVLNDTVYHAVAVNEKIYMFLARTIHTLHTKTLKWEILESKDLRLYSSTMLYYDKIIYCFGSAYEDFVDKIRRFDTLQNQWLRDDNRMKVGRGHSAAAALGENIYLTGGAIHNDVCLNIVEKYNPSDGKWGECPAMLSPRAYHQCIGMEGKIYVCGGYTANTGTLSSAEVYDLLANQWIQISALTTPRDSFSLVSYKNKIYALGGRLATARSFFDKLIYDFEVYDPVNDQWKSNSPLPERFKYAVSIHNAAT